MKKREKIVGAAASALLLAALAGAAAGGESDPLISMSYLTEVNAPAILQQVDEKLESREQALLEDFDEAISRYEADMDAKLAASGGSTGGTGTSSVFSVVTLSAGQSLQGSVGCELLLRSGSATCVASSAPGLIDSTGGTTLPGRSAVEPDHLYLVTADGRGIRASTDVTVLVRGGYTIA